MTAGAPGALALESAAAGPTPSPSPVRATTGVTGADWRAVWERDPDALVTQGPAWMSAATATRGLRDISRRYDFGERRFVLPLVRRWNATAASMPNAWGFGGLVGGHPSPDEVGAVLEDLRTLPLASVRVRPNPLHHDAWSRGAGPGVTTIARRAHVADLDGGIDAVFARFSKRARTHVRRAERSGLEVRCDTTGALLPVFHELFEQSVRRWAARQHEPAALALARARRRDPRAKLERLMAATDGAARLWVAWADGRPAAAILVLVGASAHYTRGAIDAELSGRTRASYLLHKLAMEDACAAGCRHYHMGETGTSDSLAQFKEAVGARPVDYCEYLVERLPVSRADRAARTAAKRLLRMDG